MKLPNKQREALTELINIGYGRAASSLSELTGDRITLQVPKVDVHFVNEIRDTLQAMYQQEVWSVHQVFSGSLNGHAMLLVDEKAAMSLTTRVLHDESPTTADTRDTLQEVANIVLQAAVGICGEILHVHVSFTVPGLRVDSVSEMLTSAIVAGSELQYALLVQTRFQIEARNVSGHMLVVLGVDSFTRLMDALDKWDGQLD